MYPYLNMSYIKPEILMFFKTRERGWTQFHIHGEVMRKTSESSRWRLDRARCKILNKLYMMDVINAGSCLV